MKRLFAISFSLALTACCFGFQQNPNARPGADPSVRESFSPDELSAQQAGPSVFAGPAPGMEESTTPECSEPEDSGNATALAVTDVDKEPAKIDGKQVMRQADVDVKEQAKSPMLRGLIGLLVCGCLGFGGIAFARSWVERRIPGRDRAAQR